MQPNIDSILSQANKQLASHLIVLSNKGVMKLRSGESTDINLMFKRIDLSDLLQKEDAPRKIQTYFHDYRIGYVNAEGKHKVNKKLAAEISDIITNVKALKAEAKLQKKLERESQDQLFKGLASTIKSTIEEIETQRKAAPLFDKTEKALSQPVENSGENASRKPVEKKSPPSQEDQLESPREYIPTKHFEAETVSFQDEIEGEDLDENFDIEEMDDKEYLDFESKIQKIVDEASELKKPKKMEGGQSSQRDSVDILRGRSDSEKAVRKMEKQMSETKSRIQDKFSENAKDIQAKKDEAYKKELLKQDQIKEEIKTEGRKKWDRKMDNIKTDERVRGE